MGANLILPAGSAAAAASTPADPVTRSLRFKDDAYLSFTPSTATSTRQKAVINFWFKLAEPEAGSARYCVFFSAGNVQGSGTEWFGIHYNANTGKLHISDRMGVAAMVATDAVYRDYGAWYNLHLILDSTQSTSTDRLKLYINGELQSLTGTYPTLNQNFKIGTAAPLRFGYQDNPGYHGTTFGPQVYIANAYVLENSTLPFTDFIEDTGFGSYKPKSTSGLTFGNNGFHIDAQPAHDADLLVSSIDRNDGDTLFADAAKGHVLTASGNTHHDNTVGNPFGSGTAMYFDGNGDTIVAAASSDFAFGTGDFTVEGWWYFESIPSSTDAMLVDFRPTNSTTTTSFAFSTDTTNGVKVYSGGNYALGGSLSTDTWHHIALVRDSGTLYAYIDGTATGTTQTLTADLSTNGTPRLGTTADGGTSAVFTGYVFDVRITKGTARYTSNFTAPSSAFELNPVYIGADQSGNKNHFEPTNISSHDVMLDTPTSNFCTFSPISGPPRATTTISEGNLKVVGGFSTYYPRVMGTVAVSSGKWFYEVRCGSNHTSSRDYGFKGVNTGWPTGGYGLAGGSSSWANESEMAFSAYYGGVKFSNSSTPATTGTTWGSDGDVIGLALDLDSSPRTLRVFKNGSEVGSATDIPSGGSTGWVPCIDETSSGPQTSVANFGQDPTFGGLESGTTYTSDNTTGVVGEFHNPIPSGYLPFASANLDDPTIKPHEHFAAAKYTGAGGSEEIDLGFTPNLTWIKRRVDSGYYHGLYDSARGLSAGALASNTTDAEDSTQRVASFDSDTGSEGFTLSSTHYSYTNTSGKTYISWNWKESASAGFDIVTYEGDSDTSGDTQSISHSLGVAPEMIIVKARDGRAANDYYARDYWYVWHKDLTSGSSLYLNDLSAAVDYSSGYTAAPISSVGSSTFTVCNAEESNNYYYDFLNWGDPYGYYTGSNERYVAYLFSSVEGVCDVGSYTPNGNADGPFIYTGFRPAFVMTKWTGSYGSGQGWSIKDSARDTYNPAQALLHPNASSAEGTNEPIDLLSNGFKIRGTNHTINSSSSTDKYIYIAFAESPFKYSNAR